MHRQPGLYLASGEGLRWCGLRHLGLHTVGAGTFEHTREIAMLAAALHSPLTGWSVIGEREIRARERDDDNPFASAVVGELPGGRPSLHRPDLALLAPDGRVTAVELELSLKAPRRLQRICSAWARARCVTRVFYLADGAVARAVERAIAEIRAADRIAVVSRGAVEDLVDGVAGVVLHG